MEFIKVLCIDEYLDNSVCIVNKEEISYFELQSYYREDSVMGYLFLKNGTKLLISEEGVKFKSHIDGTEMMLTPENYSF